MLQYKTRGKSDPSGKPRVYFCCHPEDFSLYFEKLSEEVLSLQNCAIWYRDTDEVRTEEELSFDLSQMQLFIMPITAKLLNTENRGIREFRFAMQEHIPVLPLMQETNLAEQFNQVCGDLEYLDESVRDITAIGYQEKLKKYLEAVLISDELAGQVRAAFDAYIFLSYRKKDRKYAQDLMHLIHANDFCRDVAIWYDEFLTPGEDFTKAIASALQKSSLFALVVTPNLVNEENYVMTTEYPAARREQKPILPVELVHTDPKALEAHYAEFPGCIDGKNLPALSASLLKTLQNLARNRSGNNPQHDFFIGLAYLNGIDVEVDCGKALSLLRAASEAGLPEAIEKLADMYTNGEGVERNYETAVLFLRQLAAQREKDYKSSGTDDSLMLLLQSLLKLGDAQASLAHLEPAMETYRRMEAIVSNIPHTDQFFWFSSAISSRIGNILTSEGRIAEAEECYEKTLKLSKHLVHKTKDSNAFHNMAILYAKLGILKDDEGKLSEAESFYRKYLKLCKNLLERGDVPTARYDLASAYERIGSICRDEGRLADAEESFLHFLELSSQLAEETSSLADRDSVACAYLKMGDLREIEGRLPEAEEFYKKGMCLYEQLAGETGTVQTFTRLADSYDHTGFILDSEGKPEEAEPYYQKGYEIFERLAAETGTIDARLRFSISCSRMADICSSKNDSIKAEEFYQKNIILLEQLASETDSLEIHINLASAYEDTGFFLYTEDRYAEAEDMYLKSLKLSEMLFRKSDSIKTRRNLCAAYQRLGDLRMSQGNYPEAGKYYVKDLHLSTDSLTDTPAAWRDLSFILYRMGKLREAEENLEGAEDFYQEFAKACDLVEKKTDTAESRSLVIEAYKCLGGVQYRRKRISEAAESYARYMAVSETYAEETGTMDAYCELARSCYLAAGIQPDTLDRDLLRKAYDILEQLCREAPDNEEYTGLREATAHALDLIRE
ncbi:MAG: TIR domain-containing protein [Lachnospiraceae bacterium]|jgi:tetratricopeptide (TPR) repeat protein|nr:TIR domain-containing protein [Lachnospiraceae bacterium]MCI1726961.1 TIR domain-containing protein [Lachnospiraceae bacterium]